MKSLLAAIALSLFPVATYAGDVASVNFKAIKDDLREYYFSRPENAETKEKFQTAVQAEKKQMEEMQKKVLSGGKAIDLKEMKALMPSMGAEGRYELERKLDTSLKKELYLIVSGLGLKYELIYDASSAETIIFAKSQVDDVTSAVRQAIIDLGQKK